MEVTFLEEGHFDAWNNFSELSPQGSMFSTTGYLDACQANYKVLACYRAEEIVGGIVLSKSKWGKYTNPILCKYLGILLHPFDGSKYQVATNQRQVQKVLIDFIGKKRQFNYMFHPNYTDWLPFHWKGYKQTTNYTYRISLEGEEDISANFYSRLRGKINKVKKEGRYKLRDDLSFEEVFRLMSKSFEHQNKKSPFQKDWLRHYVDTLEKIGGIMITGIEDHSGNLNSVLGIVTDKRCQYLVLNGLDHQSIEAGQNELLIHNSILHARESGCKAFDFEGSMIRNVESFYRQFGGDLLPYYRIKGA